MNLVFRSSCKEEFCENGIFRKSCTLTLSIESVVEILQKNTSEVSPPASLLKNELLHNDFLIILISFQNSCFFRTPLSNLLCLLICTFVEILIFLYFQDFLFSSLKDITLNFLNKLVLSLVFSLPV